MAEQSKDRIDELQTVVAALGNTMGRAGKGMPWENRSGDTWIPQRHKETCAG